MKVIFLDVDGVLNSLRSCVALGGYGWIGSHESWQQLDPVALGLLREVVSRSEAKVVLSSSWRILAEPADIVAFEKFLRVEIVGETPRSARGFRGEEIAEWLSKNPVEAFCIVDDDSDMLESQEDFFVQTDERIGMTFQNASDMLTILTGEAL